ncbi:hypothetical protein [Polaromonas sp. SM01]|uniref:hypothetical protein n=1 Tax=Polaromonas sp. SM01 TaxID=3085630 RepID=UPI0029819442|nr:hypothetical protein [Polaromonas sp. SM01]MDW5443739.1 hypothetical protein [Polaromonas sp. SM01]
MTELYHVPVLGAMKDQLGERQCANEKRPCSFLTEQGLALFESRSSLQASGSGWLCRLPSA